MDLNELFSDHQVVEATFSKPVSAFLRLIAVKGKEFYQLTTTKDNKAFHQNIPLKDIVDYITQHLMPQSKQAIFYTVENDFYFLKDKKGTHRLLKKPSSKRVQSLEHNRPKKHILPEGTPLPFLIELGLMKPNGSLIPSKTDKFRQINRFLEMVQDLLPKLGEMKNIQIVDFGCGKGYLTFALYHFLNELHGLDVHLTGLDLKADVMQTCQQLAKHLGYAHLSFEQGDIQSFVPKHKVHMVVALHACNTATDAALAKAIEWGAEIILSAPCCQHELYKQVQSAPLQSLLQHGILREKFAALATDAVRADLLEMLGYKTQVIEFIDPEHTPKNILIRAVKGNSPQRVSEAKKRYLACKAALHINPTLEGLLQPLLQSQNPLACE